MRLARSAADRHGRAAEVCRVCKAGEISNRPREVAFVGAGEFAVDQNDAREPLDNCPSNTHNHQRAALKTLANQPSGERQQSFYGQFVTPAIAGGRIRLLQIRRRRLKSS